MASFPPIPVYPNGLDSDFTLYKVFNSSEAPLSSDNNAYADQIDIVGQDREMWADNGFINLSGELIYYEGVDRDGDDRVIRFKRCLRGINGFSQFNAAGTYVRGFVVAEQHNQMALATILTEQFIGFNLDPNEITLDWRIRNLADQDRIPDDFSCPEVQFDFQIVSQSPATGTVVSYSVIVAGPFGSAVVSFGDGSSTTTLTGTHTYSVNTKIDPVVTVSNGNCQIVQTPIERDEVAEPTTTATAPPFTVPVPISPAFPSLVFPSGVFPSIDVMPPPFVDSCLDLSPLNVFSNISFSNFDFNLSMISIVIPSIDVNFSLSLDIPNITLITPADISINLEFPSVISGDIGISFPSIPPIEFGPLPTIPSTIEFGPLPPIPTLIEFGTLPPIPSTIEFIGSPTIPSTITFMNNPTIPDEINIIYGGGVPTVINITYGGGVPTIISVIPPSAFPAVTFGAAPTISVNWGSPPSITCSCVIVCPSSSMAMNSGMNGMRGINGMNYEPLANDIAVEYDLAGLPSVISILAPNKPIRIENDIPSIIKLQVPDSFPEIKITGPVDSIPTEIRILAPKTEDMQISLIVPRFMELMVPKNIAIPVNFPEKLPMLSFDRSTMPDEIRVTGFPDSIKVEHNIPTRIEVDWSEAARTFSIPPVEVRPIEVNVDFNFQGLAQKISDNRNIQCFALIPCGNS